MKTMLIAAAVAMAAALSAPTYAADQPTIPIIVKDTTSNYWQIVLAGARKAGKDLGVKVPELGAQSESDFNGRILIMGQGAGEAVAENNVADKIKLVAFDSDDKTVKFLKDGTIAALVVQDPFRMGYEGVKTAFAASKGEKVQAAVDTGANLITKENMDTPRSQELLSPKIK